MEFLKAQTLVILKLQQRLSMTICHRVLSFDVKTLSKLFLAIFEMQAENP